MIFSQSFHLSISPETISPLHFLSFPLFSSLTTFSFHSISLPHSSKIPFSPYFVSFSLFACFSSPLSSPLHPSFYFTPFLCVLFLSLSLSLTPSLLPSSLSLHLSSPSHSLFLCTQISSLGAPSCLVNSFQQLLGISTCPDTWWER